MAETLPLSGIPDEDNGGNSGASAGHQLGQIVGNWFERYVALPVLERVADSLGLYCDSRFNDRSCRGDKLIWADADGNEVDYDFVFELSGSHDQRGIPVAFFETFWRRGARHSKDKARDDSGKLLAMRDAYPTARLLGIVAGGDFTLPARALVQSRGIDLFYTVKEKVVAAWAASGITIDYPDRLPEAQKRELVEVVKHKLAGDATHYERIAEALFALVGKAELKAFEQRVAGRIGATPQQYAVRVMDEQVIVFKFRQEVDQFLAADEPRLEPDASTRWYGYEVTFGDGDSYARSDLAWPELAVFHGQLDALTDHMEQLAESG